MLSKEILVTTLVLLGPIGFIIWLVLYDYLPFLEFTCLGNSPNPISGCVLRPAFDLQNFVIFGLLDIVISYIAANIFLKIRRK
jgi:hypothetical protein